MGDIASSFEYGFNAAAEEYDGENKYIRITDIDDNTHEFLTDNLTSPDIALTGADNYKLTEGDILFARTGASVGKSYIYRNSDGLVYYAGFLIRARIKEEYDAEFVFQNTLTDRYNKYIFVTSQRSGQPGVNAQEYAEFEVKVPKKEEQTKIGAYFRNLDRLITLHQRIIYKFSEKLTFTWEQRKLGDIAEFSKGSGYSKGDLIESGTPIILYGRLYTKYETSISEVDTYVEAKDGSVYSKGGEVIVPASGETAEDIARAATVDKSGVILGGDLNVVSPNEDINSAFLAISISHGNSQRELAKKAQGKSVVHIHNEEIKNLVVPFPAKAEQNKIVEYFSNIDDLITFHQRNPCNLNKFMAFDWEQRKCKDIFDRVSKAVDVEEEAGEVYREIGIRSHGKGLFYKDEITGEGLGNKRVFWVEPNSFILNIVFAWERAVTKTTEKELGMIASHRFPMYKPKENVADLDYITKFFITHKGKYILEMASPGGAGEIKRWGKKSLRIVQFACRPMRNRRK